jgi:putative pyruvate formate lyase activating enzyme
MYPSYINLYKSGELLRRVRKAYEALRCCKLCPRECGVNRLKDELGFCRTGKLAKVASHNLHLGEEPPISGSKGSGTIFFANCNLKCKFCQNYPISQLGHGKIVTPKRLAAMMMSLQKRGAHNINLVTPSHVIPQFLAGLYIAIKMGLKLPIVYNSSGYDGMESLHLIDGVVDIYMPDIKYDSNVYAQKLSSAGNYCIFNRIALKEMYRQVGVLECDSDGIARRGILIRHLILPDGMAGSAECFDFIAKNLSKDVVVNLMSQYFPAFKALDDPLMNRRITKAEFQNAKKALLKQGLTSGWIQKLD